MRLAPCSPQSYDRVQQALRELAVHCADELDELRLSPVVARAGLPVAVYCVAEPEELPALQVPHEEADLVLREPRYVGAPLVLALDVLVELRQAVGKIAEHLGHKYPLRGIFLSVRDDSSARDYNIVFWSEREV